MINCGYSRKTCLPQLQSVLKRTFLSQKKAKTLVNRGFVEKQKKYVTQLLIKDLRSGSSTSPSLKKSQTLDPLKVARRHARWIITVQSYVVGINKILSCVTAKRATALKQLIVDLNPPLFCLSSLVITRFLDGSYQIWNAIHPRTNVHV